MKRDGVEVTGAGVITINADLRVGDVQETITVTGETPIVDVQSTRRQQVIDDETLNALPGDARLQRARSSWCPRSRAAATRST